MTMKLVMMTWLMRMKCLSKSTKLRWQLLKKLLWQRTTDNNHSGSSSNSNLNAIKCSKEIKD